jgi:dihydroorotase
MSLFRLGKSPVSASIDPARARKTVDVSGPYVTPGIVDMHTHLFYTTDS